MRGNVKIIINTQFLPYDLIFFSYNKVLVWNFNYHFHSFQKYPYKRAYRLSENAAAIVLFFCPIVVPRISWRHSANSCGIFAVRPSFESFRRSANSPKWNQPLRKVFEMRSLTDEMAPTLSFAVLLIK